MEGDAVPFTPARGISSLWTPAFARNIVRLRFDALRVKQKWGAAPCTPARGISSLWTPAFAGSVVRLRFGALRVKRKGTLSPSPLPEGFHPSGLPLSRWGFFLRFDMLRVFLGDLCDKISFDFITVCKTLFAVNSLRKTPFGNADKSNTHKALQSSTGSYPQDVKTVDNLGITHQNRLKTPQLSQKIAPHFSQQAGNFLPLMEYTL